MFQQDKFPRPGMDVFVTVLLDDGNGMLLIFYNTAALGNSLL